MKLENLESMNPSISQEWDFTKNGELKPSEINAHSSKIVWWICPNGHNYEKSVYLRTVRNQGCPLCRLEKNSFQKKHPELLKYWDYEKNIDLLPSEISYGSEKIVWWRCDNNHSYQQKINAKSSGRKCPICTHQKISYEYSLGFLYPELAKEWHTQKNKDLSPFDVFPSTHKKVWWKCCNGHEYQTRVYARKHSGCPICDAEKRTSFPEEALLFYLGKLFPVESRAIIGKFEADIYCPSVNIAIEYDGEYFHNTEAAIIRDKKKNDFFLSQNILLFRIKESKTKTDFNVEKKVYGYDVYIFYEQDYLFISKVLSTILNIINEKNNLEFHIDVDIQRDKVSIIKQYAITKAEGSFISQKPLGAKKWDYRKNGNINLSLLPKSSKKKYWWKCPSCGNEWYGSLDNIVNSLTCNKCSRQINTNYDLASEIYITDKNRLVELQKNLQIENPDLAKEWHPSKNGLFLPCHVPAKSHKRVWWLCPKCGNEWTQIISTRNNGKTARKCPKCANNQKKEKIGIEKISSLLFEEWNSEKNRGKDLKKLTAGSSVEAWWMCKKCGTEFKCQIKHRKNGMGCPVCGRKRASKAKYKRIINLDTNEIFDSVNEAAQKYNLKSHSSISQCLHGKSKTAGGFHWDFYDK